MSIIMHDDEQGYPTVRRYSRSLSEAFPDVRAQAVEPWQKESASQSAQHLIRQVIGYAVALLAAALLFLSMTQTAHAGRRDCCRPNAAEVQP